MRLNLFIRLTAFVIVSLALGIGSARWLIARTATSVTATTGVWKTWLPDTGSGSDPYAAAHYLLNGHLPPARNQERVFETDRDDQGDAFDSRCTYVLTGPAQAMRWWQIALVLPQAEPDDVRRASDSSAQAIIDADGNFRLAISREPKPGNWISPGASPQFSLIMKIRPVRARENTDPKTLLPQITRGECA